MTTKEKIIRQCKKVLQEYHISPEAYPDIRAEEFKRDSWIASGTGVRLFYAVWEVHFSDNQNHEVIFDSVYVDKWGRIEQFVIGLH